jgi:hypothetical protein
VQVIVFWFPETANILQCADFLLQSAVNITAQFADMIPYLATTMQFANVSFALLQILPDGKAPCNELMLHHAMQCTGASCRMLQIPSNFAADTTQLRDSNSKRPTYGTPILSHRGAFIKTCFHTGIYTYTCFYPGMVLRANTFMRRCFYTGMLLYKKNFYTQTRGHFYTQMPLHSDSFTEECFYTHVHLHRVSFDTN